MIQTKVVFLESNTTGTGRLFMRAARAEGCEPVLLATNPGLYPFAVEEAVQVVQIDTADEAAVLEFCIPLARSGGLAGLTSTSDYYILAAARMAARLGLPGPSVGGIETCRDKQLQHDALSAAGVPVPATCVVEAGGDVSTAMEELGLPVVVKPVGGSGSVGVRLCRSADEVRQHAALLLSRTLNERGIPIRRAVLLQALAEGPEFSVETLAGRVIGITQKHVSAPPVFIELGHDFPAMLSSEQRRSIATVALDAVTALDLTWGAAHTELRLTDAGPVIIEVNPRMAGGFIPELVRRATGIDLIRDLTRRVLGREPSLEHTAAGHASIRFLVPERDGTLTALGGEAEARAVAEVCDLSLYRAPGFMVALTGDFHDRIGHVMTASHDPVSARTSADHALALLTVALA